METNELVQKVKEGDCLAFERLYENYAQRIFRYVRVKIQCKQEAEDVLQEIFIKAYKGIPNLPLEGLNFTAWLYRISGNCVNDYFRKKYRSPGISPIDEHFDIPDKVSVFAEMQTKSEVETARSTFKYLPPLYKEVLELRFIRDFSPEQTAKILKKSNLAIRLLQFRALKKVRVILHNQLTIFNTKRFRALLN